MERKEPPMSDETGPPLKRSRQEDLDKAEEEEGLLALVKKRRSDVKVLVSRIQTLEAQLKDSKNKLALAETLLETMRSGQSEEEPKQVPAERPPENGNIRKPWPTSINAKSGDRVGKSNTSRPSSDTAPTPSKGGNQGSNEQATKSRRESPVRNKSETDRKDRKEGSGGRSAAESDKRDKKESSGERSAADRDRKESSGGREAQEGDRRDRRDKYESSGARGTSEADRKDKSNHNQQPGKETTQKPANPPAPAPKEHVDLIMKIRSQKKAVPVPLHGPLYTPSQHRRKMRSLILNPATDHQCATSGLDGVVNFWQIHAKGLDINFRYGVDCLSPGQRHWPEDMVWHPEGHSIFAVYTADHQDSQVAIIKNDSKKKVTNFLPNKPHVKGIMNAISFMPWSSSQFVTGGSDHLVVMWKEEGEDKWKPKVLHQSLHSSAVMGVAGTRHKQLVLSAGCDKRVFGFDPVASRMAFQHQLDSKAMSVLPNTADFNLFMVQTGTPSKQLHLYDIRAKTELHTFGWVQESSDTQSALITQSWSPDGLYTASGSADPKIPIFDIRFNGREPAQTIYAHTKRVFMAVWHHRLPMILSISSDLNIGVHRIYR